jgi:hypothetical protein
MCVVVTTLLNPKAFTKDDLAELYRLRWHAELDLRALARTPLLEAFYSIPVTHRVGQRPDRIEPRAVKRRPKPYALLTIPRDKARQQLIHGRLA